MTKESNTAQKKSQATSQTHKIIDAVVIGDNRITMETPIFVFHQ